MAVDLSSLKAKVAAHAVDLATVALEAVQADLDEQVPDSDRSGSSANRLTPRIGDKLRDTRVVVQPTLDGTTVRASVTYTAEHAEITNTGPEPHTIPVGGRQAQRSKGYPMKFMVDGEVVRAFEVDWKPGPGVQANIGWFDRGLAGWSDHLQAATGQVSS